MSEPIRHHYIPRSYLKYFATKIKNEYFSDIYDARESRLLRNQNISSFCFKKDLYSLKSSDPKLRFFLEKFYATDVDAYFSEIHDLLVNPSVINISKDQKEKIISCLLSLYFRTTKFLHGGWNLFEDIFEEVLRNKPNEENLSFVVNKTKYEFRRSDADSFKSNTKEEFRQQYILSQFEMWLRYYEGKLLNGMSVYKVSDDIKLITSDNPVIIGSSVGNRFHLFDPTNIIQIPIDSNHFLFIMPDEDQMDPLRIVRADRDKWFALTNNSQMETLSERWIIAPTNGIEAHLEQQIRLNSPGSEEADIYLDQLKQKFHFSIELKMLMDKHRGNIYHSDIFKFLEKCSSIESLKSDTDFQSLYSRLKKSP